MSDASKFFRGKLDDLLAAQEAIGASGEAWSQASREANEHLDERGLHDLDIKRDALRAEIERYVANVEEELALRRQAIDPAFKKEIDDAEQRDPLGAPCTCGGYMDSVAPTPEEHKAFDCGSFQARGGNVCCLRVFVCRRCGCRDHLQVLSPPTTF